MKNLKINNIFIALLFVVSGQLSPEENCPTVRVGVLVKVRVSFRVGGNHTIVPEKNWLLVRARVWVKVSLGVGGQLSLGAIALEALFVY